MPTIPLTYDQLVTPMTILGATCLALGLFALFGLMDAIDEHGRKEKP